MTTDPEKCKAFYGAVFDWKLDDKSMPGYTLVNTGADPGGGIFPKPEDAPGACINVYFQVEDIEAILAKVTEHGGRVLVPKTEIPTVGSFAMFADPDGIAVGIMRSAN
jgi:predicted enzyme related to lactoylglutathione lyase